MSDFRKVIPAIIAWAEGDPAIVAEVTGVYDDIPHKANDYPYIIVEAISSAYSPGSGGQEVDEDVYQFSIYDGRNRPPTRAMDIQRLVEERFHNTAVSIPGATTVKFTRASKGKNGDRDNGWLVWQRFDVWTQDT